LRSRKRGRVNKRLTRAVDEYRRTLSIKLETDASERQTFRRKRKKQSLIRMREDLNCLERLLGEKGKMNLGEAEGGEREKRCNIFGRGHHGGERTSL